MSRSDKIEAAYPLVFPRVIAPPRADSSRGGLYIDAVFQKTYDGGFSTGVDDRRMVDNLFQFVQGTLGLWSAVFLFLLGGVVGLKYGADWLVNGSSNLGFRFGVSAAMIGLTIVAMGTSAPELVVSVLTAAKEKPEISLGNVIGSNIANITLILGITALISPLRIQKDSVKLDGTLSFLAISLVFVLALIGRQLRYIDGAILVLAFGCWMLWLVRKSLRQAADHRKRRSEGLEEEIVFQPRPNWTDLLRILLGLVLLVVGADALVASAVTTARALNVSDIVVGLTLVAGGTSLPELAVCVVAALRKHGDITVGNVLGSNLFNALLILGVAVLIHPIYFNIQATGLAGDRGTLFIDIPFCVLMCGLLIPIMRHKYSLGRGRGILLLAIYLAYITSLVLRAL